MTIKEFLDKIGCYEYCMHDFKIKDCDLVLFDGGDLFVIDDLTANVDDDEFVKLYLKNKIENK